MIYMYYTLIDLCMIIYVFFVQYSRLDNNFVYRQRDYYLYLHFIIFTIDKSLPEWYTLVISTRGRRSRLLTDK